MLKITGVKLELISDVDMQLFIEKDTRGGISYLLIDTPRLKISICETVTPKQRHLISPI